MRALLFGMFLLNFCTNIPATCAQESPTFKIPGVITDADSHAPLPGVSVSVIGDKAVTPAITNDNGSFILELPSTFRAGRDVWVKFEKQGYLPEDEPLPTSAEAQLTFTMRQFKTNQLSKPKSSPKEPDKGSQTQNESHGTTDSVKVSVQRHGTEDTATAKVMSAEEAFSVAVETRLLVPGPSKDTSGIGFWALSGLGNNCYLSSVDTALFIRVKNLQPKKVMITAYNVYAVGGELVRLRMDINKPFVILGHGKLRPSMNRSAPIQMPVPSGNLGAFVMFPLKDADPSVADPIEAEFLDNKLGARYLEPGESARGWAFFKYPNTATMPADMRIRISDDLGHSFTYAIPDETGNPAGDTLQRLIALGPTVDLSSCAMQPPPAIHDSN